MNTSLPRVCRIQGWRCSTHSRRAWRTSGLSCSLARNVFFETITVADQPARQRRGVGAGAGCRCQLICQLRHGDIGSLGHSFQDKAAVTIELETTLTTKLTVIDPTRLAQQHHQFDDKRRRYPEVGCSRPARMTRLDKRNNALTQIIRKRLDHRESPPHPRSESRTYPFDIPLDSIRSHDALGLSRPVYGFTAYLVIPRQPTSSVG